MCYNSGALLYFLSTSAGSSIIDDGAVLSIVLGQYCVHRINSFPWCQVSSRRLSFSISNILSRQDTQLNYFIIARTSPRRLQHSMLSSTRHRVRSLNFVRGKSNHLFHPAPFPVRSELIFHRVHDRLLMKGSSARIRVQLRAPPSGSSRRAVIPLETFAANKSMGRVLFRRDGQTVAAGIVLEVLI